MDTKKAILEIIHLPKKFYNNGNKSIYILLEETGYFEIFDHVTEINIYNALDEQPSVISEWKIWSENKRNDSGWYFIKEENANHFMVNFLPARGGYDKREFFDEKKACAAFIKLEVEDIRISLQGS